jgi:predicted membrane-bound mannosyltransferase
MRIIITCLLLSLGIFVSAQDTSVQKKDLISSAKLFDLSFTTKEIDTLYSDVIDNIANFKAMHNFPLANSVPLSMWQTPVLPGMHFN